jgi:hypothetical protein
LDLVSNDSIKGANRRRAAALFAAGLLALAIAAVLTGCGDLSLNQLLENEEPGEFTISPTGAYVPAAGTLDMSGQGGFKPYAYANLGTVGSIDPDTGVFMAPVSITGDPETTDIEVTDSFGRSASTTVTVFAPISISPSVKTVGEADTVDFAVLGGVPPYDFYVNGSLEGSSSGNWSRPFTTEGSYSVEAVDSLQNTAVAVITVERNLAIILDEPWVLVSGTIDLTVINATGGHTLSTEPSGIGSFDDPIAVTATYTAPDFETVVTLVVEDGALDTATVDLHVLSAAPEPLAFPTSITVLVNQEVQLTATGGIEPHTFWLVGPGSLSPHPVQEYRIRYLAPSSPTTAYVWVQDALGRQAKTTITVIAGS